MTNNENWKTNMIIGGAVIGAITGVVAIYILIHNAEKSKSHPELGTGEGIKLGLGVLTLLRLVSDLGKHK